MRIAIYLGIVNLDLILRSQRIKEFNVFEQSRGFWVGFGCILDEDLNHC